MKLSDKRIGYVVADLKRIGPTNQTLNIIRYSGAIGNCVVITLFPESADTQIADYEAAGIRVVCLGLSRKTVLLRGVKTLCAALKAEGVDFVHSWGTFADITAHYACRKLRMPHMLTLRNFPVEEMTTRMPRPLGLAVAKFDLHILKNCRHVVCCSNAIRRKMEETYGWTHLSAIRNGVDFRRFSLRDRAQMRRELGVPDGAVIFIATGSIIPRKRIDETADAFLAAGLPAHCSLWFLGEGSLLPAMREKYAGCGNIVFHGKQADVVKYLSAADAFVSSSESEGMPNAVLEAIACRLPVYLSDIPQHLEVFEGIPGCGRSYPLGDRAALAELFAAADDAALQEMRGHTLQLTDSDFTMENMGKKYAQYYETLIRQAW